MAFFMNPPVVQDQRVPPEDRERWDAYKARVGIRDGAFGHRALPEDAMWSALLGEWVTPTV